ncbi:hypothetical protein MSH26_01485 [bacterium]|nr:hypothetical protein [bacterium]
MAYRINDEIFFLKIDEQVEYLTQVINELYSKDIKIINTNINNLSAQVNNLNETKQDKTSDELKTEVKNIVGSINELFDKIESETNRAVNSENEISTNLTEYENHVNPILESHTSSISSINDNIRSLQDNKQSKIDERFQTTSKEVVGAINENHNAIVTNEALIDTKQDKTDNSLKTTNKTIVGAINELKGSGGSSLSYLHKINFTINFDDINVFGTRLIILRMDLITREKANQFNSEDLIDYLFSKKMTVPVIRDDRSGDDWKKMPIFIECNSYTNFNLYSIDASTDSSGNVLFKPLYIINASYSSIIDIMDRVVEIEA